MRWTLSFPIDALDTQLPSSRDGSSSNILGRAEHPSTSGRLPTIVPTSAGPSSRLHGLVPIRITISSIVHSSSLEHCSRYRTVDSSDIFQRYSPRAAYFLVVLHISYLGCTGRASDRWRSPAASTLFTGAFQLHAICFRLQTQVAIFASNQMGAVRST